MSIPGWFDLIMWVVCGVLIGGPILQWLVASDQLKALLPKAAAILLGTYEAWHLLDRVVMWGRGFGAGTSRAVLVFVVTDWIRFAIVGPALMCMFIFVIVLVLAVLHGATRVVTAIGYRVADYPKGTVAGMFALGALVVGLADLCARSQVAR